jgi:hypothetical protein
VSFFNVNFTNSSILPDKQDWNSTTVLGGFARLTLEILNIDLCVFNGAVAYQGSFMFITAFAIEKQGIT